nr:hypothetical protein CFP56_74593 [Quercus suber]
MERKKSAVDVSVRRRLLNQVDCREMNPFVVVGVRVWFCVRKDWRRITVGRLQLSSTFLALRMLGNGFSYEPEWRQIFSCCQCLVDIQSEVDAASGDVKSCASPWRGQSRKVKHLAIMMGHSLAPTAILGYPERQSRQSGSCGKSSDSDAAASQYAMPTEFQSIFLVPGCGGHRVNKVIGLSSGYY